MVRERGYISLCIFIIYTHGPESVMSCRPKEHQRIIITHGGWLMHVGVRVLRLYRMVQGVITL